MERREGRSDAALGDILGVGRGAVCAIPTSFRDPTYFFSNWTLVVREFGGSSHVMFH